MAEKKKKGYVPVWRDLQDHWIWTSDEPYDSRSAWVDLLLSANHSDTKVKYGCGYIIVHEGQMLTSLCKLAKKWHWSRDKVRRYLNMLEKDEMIHKSSTHRATLLTLVNYGNFSISSNTDKTTNKATGKTTNKATDKAQTRMIKNEKELKELEKEKAAPPSDGGEWQ